MDSMELDQHSEFYDAWICLQSTAESSEVSPPSFESAAYQSEIPLIDQRRAFPTRVREETQTLSPTPSQSQQSTSHDAASSALPSTSKPQTALKKGRPGRKAEHDEREWLSKKQILKTLYLDEAKSLSAVSKVMDNAHGFKASENMYKKKFAAWGFFKNQSQCRPIDSITQALSGTSDRARSAQSLPQKQFQDSEKLAYRLDKHLSLLAPDDPRLAQLEKTLFNVWGYFMRVFDRGSDGVSGWTGDFFSLNPPEGYCDNSSDWKAVSDQCHGASILVTRPDDTNGKCQKTLHKALSLFDKLLQKKDPWMLVYIWRIILYMRGIAFRLEPRKKEVSSVVLARNRDDHLVGNFLTGIIGLIKIHLDAEDPMVYALESLRFFCLQDIKLPVERVYQLCIDLFMDYLGNFHPVVLSMTGHFLKYWPGKLGEHVLPSYDKVVKSAEVEFGLCDERTISLLTEYMYMANYHGQDSSLIFKLATNLKERTDRLEMKAKGNVGWSAWVLLQRGFEMETANAKLELCK
ncbi:hypothetical protein RB213_005302 [Colletotrichum asianum]